MKNRDLPRWSTLFFGLSAPALIIAVAITGYLRGFGLAGTIGFAWLHISSILASWLLFGGLLYVVICWRELKAFSKRVATLMLAARKAAGLFAVMLFQCVIVGAFVLWHPFGVVPSIGARFAIVMVLGFVVARLAQRLDEKTKQSLQELQNIFDKVHDDEDHTMYGV
ncbi:MAG: hypothetical protein ABSD96_06050 [Candidatus Korobacteraceae bacterium]|jgi:cation transport ATPase